MSVDGKTTKGNDPNIYKWTSKEDQKHFFSLIEKFNVIIMGRKTFLAAKGLMKLSPKKLRLVITKNPNSFKQAEIPGQLEFTSDSPEAILRKLQKRKYKEILLAGGANINTLFFKVKLVNELWLTIEPYIFGSGNSLVADEKLNVNLHLKSVKRLNTKGTLFLKYKVY